MKGVAFNERWEQYISSPYVESASFSPYSYVGQRFQHVKDETASEQVMKRGYYLCFDILLRTIDLCHF